MVLEWLPGIKSITDIVSDLNKSFKKDGANKNMLVRELQLNINAFGIAHKSKSIDYDKLLDLLKNKQIINANSIGFSFHQIKSGSVKEQHVRDGRNKKYIGKNCEWLFNNIDAKIMDLRNQKEYFGSLNNSETSNITLQFSNLFYKMKLLADFISNRRIK